MLTLTDIKRRIKTIKDTKQITKAMYLISSSKLNKALDQYKRNTAYFNRIRSTMKDIAEHTDEEIAHPWLVNRGGSRAAYIVISADKGLCGPYNHNVLNKAMDHMSNYDGETFTFVVGQIAREVFNRKGYTVDVEFLYASQNPTYYNAREIAEDIIRLYDMEMMDEVYIAYTHMVSSLKQEPRIIKLLPVEQSTFTDIESDFTFEEDMLYHPSSNELFDLLIPHYVIGVLYGCLVQSFASEQKARMTAMDTATDNADDMMSKLQKQYNRARQAAITMELAEIVGGVEALKNMR